MLISFLQVNTETIKEV